MSKCKGIQDDGRVGGSYIHHQDQNEITTKI